MAKKSSTGALTPEQHAAQDAIYNQGYSYDYLFIGAGHSALVAAALLANAGKKVCVLEYHDKPGGYAHTFEMQGFRFCAQIHYIWGAAPGGSIYGILRKLGLEKEVTWEAFDLDGYDVIAMPDGKRVNIANGFDKTLENIDQAYPGGRKELEKFYSILKKLRAEFPKFPRGSASLVTVLLNAWKYPTIIKYRNATLQDLFDECNLKQEHQAIFGGFLGDLASPPDEISIFPFVGLYGGYNTGSYAPTKHFEYYIDSLANAITKQDGCHIFYETEVTAIHEKDGKIVSVDTQNGKTFTAETIVCNMDPQAAAKLIGWDKFPKKEQKKLDYKYTPSAMTIYLGLKDIDLTEHGFGNFNIWHLEDLDLNTMWREQEKGNYDKIWMFLSTPLLHNGEAGHAPEGCSVLEIATLANFSFFGEAQEKNYAEYMKLKLEYANKILKRIEEKYIPNLHKHIVVKTIGTPTTNRDYAYAPEGNVYGSLMTPKNMSQDRLKKETPFENFYWCNASSGYPGMAGTAHTGIKFYEDMTGDRVLTDEELAKTDDDLISELYKNYSST